MKEEEIKLLILEVIEEVLDRNTWYVDEGESFETNLYEAIRELELEYKNS